MKTSHSIVFFVIILVAVAGFFLVFEHSQNKMPETLAKTLECQSTKIDASVYSLEGDTSLIGAFISFNQAPLTDESRDILSSLGISLYESTWIFDYVLAEIPTDSLCTLVEYDFVSRVFIPETAKNYNLIQS